MAEALTNNAVTSNAEADKLDPKGVVARAIKRYERYQDDNIENNSNAVADLNFVIGEQWDIQSKQERENDGRPCLTANLMGQFVEQVCGDARLNKPGIKVRAAGGKASKDIADIFTGMIRSIEQLSDADTAYIQALENSVVAGLGHWKIITQYEAPTGFEQEIRIKRIADALSVVFDPGARELDRSDARWAMELALYDKEAFKEEWPDAQVVDFESDAAQRYGMAWASSVRDWYSNDMVRVCQYYERNRVPRKTWLLSDGEILTDAPDGDGDRMDDATLAEYVETKNRKAFDAAMAATGQPPQTPPVTVKQSRTGYDYEVRYWTLSGCEVLEGGAEGNLWPGRYIPLIQVIGKERYIGDKVARYGLVRGAKDPQRYLNYLISASAEVWALQPKSPFIVTVDQVKNLETYWDTAGRKNWPYLPYNPDPASPNGPKRADPPTGATGMLSEIGMATQQMYGTVGIYAPSLGQKSNETSGKAIIARQREGDVGSFVFIDNLGKAIAYCGRQLVDLIPKIYDTQRQVRTLGEDGAEEMVSINTPLLQGDGSTLLANDVSQGQYDVVVQAGPSFSTRRQEASESMMELLRVMPEAAAILMPRLAQNLDWPGAEEIAEDFAKLAQANAPAQGPSPDQQAKAAKDAADAGKTEAETKGIQLDNLKKAADVDRIIQTGGASMLEPAPVAATPFPQ